ncbi:hypothetical protein AYO40_05345 [Planctomycetaceae bacterium SCGC AG-212-D15]|nr:hypothetical protein AYO40_05345 [Planctomycetaceae bacterium SCGC AG-212-D15]
MCGDGIQPIDRRGARLFSTAAIWTYVGIFSALVAAGVGFPIPEELPILTAGALCGHAAEPPEIEPELMTIFAADPAAPFPANLPWSAFVLSEEHPKLWTDDHYHRLPLKWWILLPICILGVVISDGLLYGMGRFWGPKLLEARWMKRMLPDDKRGRIEQNFQRYGVLVLLFARFLPAIRSPIFIMAGITRLSFTRFLLADGIYAIPGVTLLFTLAFWFGDSVRDLVLRAEGRAKPIIILVALTAVAAYLFYHFFHHPVATGDPTEEMPLVGSQIASHLSQSSIIMRPGPVDPSKSTLSAEPSTIAAGASTTVTLNLKDEFGAGTTTGVSSAQFSSTSATGQFANLPNEANGVYRATYSDTVPGTHTLSASYVDGSNESHNITQTQPVTVTAAPAPRPDTSDGAGSNHAAPNRDAERLESPSPGDPRSEPRP